METNVHAYTCVHTYMYCIYMYMYVYTVHVNKRYRRKEEEAYNVHVCVNEMQKEGRSKHTLYMYMYIFSKCSAITCVRVSSGDLDETPKITERSKIFTGNSSSACKRAGPKCEL